MRARQQPHRIGYAFVPEEGGELQLSYAELDRQARAVACALAGLRGQTALLAYPPGLDYIAAFFGCLYAGVIAVSAPPPDQVRPDRSMPRLAAIVRDAAPSVVLTTAAMSGAARFLPEPELSRLRVIATDEAATDDAATDDAATGDAAALDAEPAPVSADSVALLQYTSGSTAEPKGVAITHGNLMSNSELIFRLFGHCDQSRGVSWLPPHHDMGLIGGVIQPLYGGFPVTLMTPADFLHRPLKWLQEISRTGATTSGGPNLCYDLCVRKTTAHERERLDLSNWRVAFHGSQPLRAATMEGFAAAFASAGFRREAFHPCYGLAEATLIVTGGVPWSQRGVTASDHGHAGSLRDLAVRLGERLSADAPHSSQIPSEVHALESSPARPPAVRHYRWVRGSRVPTRSVLTADLFPGEHGRWSAARPRWESLPGALTALSAAASPAEAGAAPQVPAAHLTPFHLAERSPGFRPVRPAVPARGAAPEYRKLYGRYH
jgi:acyl-CoA synthetase (AMP-forming)/AMP-acid ligase II